MTGEKDSGAWSDMVALLRDGNLPAFWERYRNYLVVNGVVSDRRKVLVAAMDSTVQMMEATRLLVQRTNAQWEKDVESWGKQVDALAKQNEEFCNQVTKAEEQLAACRTLLQEACERIQNGVPGHMIEWDEWFDQAKEAA